MRMRPAAIAAGVVLAVGLVALPSTPSGATVPVSSSTSRVPSHTFVAASRMPVAGARHQLSIGRDFVGTPPAGHPRSTAVSPDANDWQLLATIPGAVIHDVAFPTSQVGYAAAELGQVWKTIDGGSTWAEVMNLGFPYYWYGVAAKGRSVVVSGFDDSTEQGVISWSHDSGQTWTAPIVVMPDGWANRIRFANPSDGLIVDQLSTNSPNAAQYTTDGGQESQDWTTVVPDPGPDAGWFGNQFTLLPDDRAYVSGITDCMSLNGGQTWPYCQPSVDPVFDGATDFLNSQDGWVGGGEISPAVEGWVHVTTDGGRTWSGRTLDDPWPIRDIDFLSPKVGWAVGGNVYSDVGGMFFSDDGGQTWTLDASTGDEMSSCANQSNGAEEQVWCVGYNFNGSSFNGVVYSLRSSAAGLASRGDGWRAGYAPVAPGSTFGSMRSSSAPSPLRVTR